MKNTVFVDTVAWLALVNKSEDLHDAARTVRDQLIQQKAKLITTDFVVGRNYEDRVYILHKMERSTLNG